MILPEPIIKKVSLDTNADVTGEADNLIAIIKNLETGVEIISPSLFLEIIKEGVPTGLYFSDLEFIESGQFQVTVQHETIGKSGTSVVTINSGPTYKDLEDTVSTLNINRRNGVSFA